MTAFTIATAEAIDSHATWTSRASSCSPRRVRRRTRCHPRAQVRFEKLWATGPSALVLDNPGVLDPPPPNNPTAATDDPATVADDGPGERL